MKYIANIISDSKVETNKFFNVTDNIDEVDLSLPTLIIGWKKVKKLYPNQNILEKKISSPNVYWTFSIREKRSDYEDDFEEFNNIVIKEMNKKVNYKFYNYIMSDDNKKERFVNYMNLGNKYIYLNNRFIYVYDGVCTTGVSLSDIDYMGISKKAFLNEINKNKNNIVLNSSFIEKNDVKSLIKGNVKALPMLNYLIEH